MPTNLYTLAGFVFEYLNTSVDVTGQNMLVSFPTFKEAVDYVVQVIKGK